MAKTRERPQQQVWQAAPKSFSEVKLQEGFCQNISSRLLPIVTEAFEDSLIPKQSVEIELFFRIDRPYIQVVKAIRKQTEVYWEDSEVARWVGLSNEPIVKQPRSSSEEVIALIKVRIAEILTEVIKSQDCCARLLLFFSKGQFTGSRRVIDQKGLEH